MITSAKMRRRWDQWAKKRNLPGNPQILNSHNLYILPSRFGWAYGVVVIIVFISAVNYQINTLFLYAFLLSIIGIVTTLESHANLKNLSIKCIAIEDTEQGKPAKITLFIQANGKARYSIEFQILSQGKILIEKVPAEGLNFTLPIETEKRGYFTLPPIVISTDFPFGIFRVWSYLYFDEHYYVFPESKDPGFWPDPFPIQNIKKKHALGDDEFYELKQVENPFLEPSRIAWKIAAKNQGWYIKIMHTNESEYWLFSLSDLPGNDIEMKLQHLSYWLHIAEENGFRYGLALDDPEARQFAHGQAHLQQCLRQLAVY